MERATMALRPAPRRRNHFLPNVAGNDIIEPRSQLHESEAGQVLSSERHVRLAP